MRILDSNNTFSNETFSDLSHDAQCPHKICSGSGIESKLPHAFIKRMRTDFETTAEYERFIACYSDAPIRAMRINTLKISKERFLDLCPQGLISQRENAVRRLRRSHYIMQCSRSAMSCALFKQARRACFRELSGIKIIVITFEFQQFAMRTGFGNSSVADNKNSVR